MADESRSYGTVGGGKDHSYLFDMLKSQRKVSQEKELMDHQNTLALGAMKERDVLEGRRLEKANEFSKLMQEFRQQHDRQMQEEAFARTQTENLLTGQAVADYTGQQAVQQANNGNVIDALVQPNAAAQTPEASVPGAGFEAKPINPRAAGVAHTDLMEGIRKRAATDETMRLKTMDQTLNRVGPDEIAQARSLAPLLRQHGLEVTASQFENLSPASWSKDNFQRAQIDAQKWLQDAAARMERVRIYSDARIQVAMLNNEAKQRIEQLKAKRDITKSELAEVKEKRLQIGAQLQTVNSGIAIIQNQLEDLTISPAMKSRLQDELNEHKRLRDNLQNTQSQIFGIEANYGLVPPSVPKADAQKIETLVRAAIDKLPGKKGRSYDDLKPQERAAVDAEMAKHGYAPEGPKN